MRLRSVTSGDMTWNLAEEGPEAGPTVVLLHGFPEYWASWEKQLRSLSAAGFRALAPDLPGYGDTSEPASYALADLADVTADLLRAVADRPVHLVGHDWGAIVAYAVAGLHPSTVASLTAASAPHPAVVSSTRGMLRDPMQLARSYYVGVFQIPGIENFLGSLPTQKLFRGAVTRMDDPDSLRRGIAYYRANLAPWKLNALPTARIQQPGMIMHAARDRYVGRALMEASAEHFDDLREWVELPCAHFLHRQCAAEFDQALISFLASVGEAGDRRPGA